MNYEDCFEQRQDMEQRVLFDKYVDIFRDSVNVVIDEDVPAVIAVLGSGTKN